MNIKDRLERIKEYFQGMEMKDELFIVSVKYPDKWGAYPSEDNTIKIAQSEDVANLYYYYANFTNVNVEDIFDLIESTIKDNLDAAKKLQLLNEKFLLLKDLFANNTLEDLQRIEIKIPYKKSRRKKNMIAEPLVNEPKQSENGIEQ